MVGAEGKSDKEDSQSKQNAISDEIDNNKKFDIVTSAAILTH